MAVVSKALARAAAATTSTTLYTTPAGSTAVITNIAITNTATSASTFTILLNDISLATAVSIAASDTTILDMKQVLPASQTIKGSASTTAVNFHISGVEIS